VRRAFRKRHTVKVKKGIGYCHSMSHRATRDTCGHAEALRMARFLVREAYSIFMILQPMDHSERYQIKKFKKAIERFERADK
jgi:hypothetical protein